MRLAARGAVKREPVPEMRNRSQRLRRGEGLDHDGDVPVPIRDVHRLLKAVEQPLRVGAKDVARVPLDEGGHPAKLDAKANAGLTGIRRHHALRLERIHQPLDRRSRDARRLREFAQAGAARLLGKRAQDRGRARDQTDVTALLGVLCAGVSIDGRVPSGLD